MEKWNIGTYKSSYSYIHYDGANLFFGMTMKDDLDKSA